MSTLTDDQIAQVAVTGGFPVGDPNNLAVCVAIAKAESSGRTDATNSNTNGTTDKGLWQINSIHDDLLPGQDRFDPNVNAQLMVQISSNGTNWQPWSTYNNNAYQAFLGEAMTTVSGKTYTPGTPTSLNPGSANTSTVGVTSTVSGIETFFSGLANPDTLIRLAQLAVGGTVILLAIVVFFHEDIAKAAVKGAKVAEVAAL
jgi:hypothetical protein